MKKKLNLVDHPPPNPVLASNKTQYMPFKEVFKTEFSKKPPVLPQPKIKKPDKSLHPGFQLSVDKIRDIIKCRDCGQPRVVYSRYGLGGTGERKLTKTLDNLCSKNEFHCGKDLSSLFTKDAHLNTKIVTVDRRLACGQSVEWQYYSAKKVHGAENNTLGICAFCGCTLVDSLTKQLQTLLTQGDKVLPNCGKATCLQSNPKANFKDGWTVTKKRERKRIRRPDLDSADAKKKKVKLNKPKPKKPKMKPKPKPRKKPNQSRKRKRGEHN